MTTSGFSKIRSLSVSWGLGALAIGAVAATGCGSARPLPEERAECVDWESTIGPRLEADCASCHSGDRPAGNYDLTSYVGVLGRGSDVLPNVTVGDGNSLLLARVGPQSDDGLHAGFREASSELRQWVMDCDMVYRNPIVHTGGVMNPGKPEEFHGDLVRTQSWSFDSCRKCHGEDLDGGGADVSCLSCHKQGVTDCTTCHGEAPRSGAHAVHVIGGAIKGALDCSECHVKPTVYTDVGHLFDANGDVITDSVEVRFGALAGATPSAAARKGPPTYNQGRRTCSNVYCHGAASTLQGTTPEPSWEPVASSGRCDACHGDPPPSHSVDRCERCHGAVAEAGRGIKDKTRHIDGVLDVGDGAFAGTCSACHGSLTSAAPPRDLQGRTSISEP